MDKREEEIREYLSDAGMCGNGGWVEVRHMDWLFKQLTAAREELAAERARADKQTEIATRHSNERMKSESALSECRQAWGADAESLRKMLADERAKREEAEKRIFTLETDGGIWDKSVYKARADHWESRAASLSRDLDLEKKASALHLANFNHAQKRVKELEVEVEVERSAWAKAAEGAYQITVDRDALRSKCANAVKALSDLNAAGTQFLRWNSDESEQDKFRDALLRADAALSPAAGEEKRPGFCKCPEVAGKIQHVPTCHEEQAI